MVGARNVVLFGGSEDLVVEAERFDYARRPLGKTEDLARSSFEQILDVRHEVGKQISDIRRKADLVEERFPLRVFIPSQALGNPAHDDIEEDGYENYRGGHEGVGDILTNEQNESRRLFPICAANALDWHWSY